MRLVHLRLEVESRLLRPPFFLKAEATSALVVLDGVHCLLLHRIELIWNQCALSNLEIALLI